VVYRVERKKGPLSYAREPRGGNATPTCQHLFRRVFGISRSSVQSSRTTTPRWPHFAHRACGSNEVIRTSSRQSSTLKVLAWPQALQVAYADRTPRARMCPSVTGWVGRSLTGGSRGFLAMSNGQAATRVPGEPMQDGCACRRLSIKAPRLGIQTRGQLWFPRHLRSRGTQILRR
jgi:hypothetical protein